MYYKKCESKLWVLTTVLLKIQVFWDVMLHCWVIIYLICFNVQVAVAYFKTTFQRLHEGLLKNMNTSTRIASPWDEIHSDNNLLTMMYGTSIKKGSDYQVIME